MGSALTTPKGFRGALPAGKLQLGMTAPGHYGDVLRRGMRIFYRGEPETTVLLLTPLHRGQMHLVNPRDGTRIASFIPPAPGGRGRFSLLLPPGLFEEAEVEEDRGTAAAATTTAAPKPRRTRRVIRPWTLMPRPSDPTAAATTAVPGSWVPRRAVKTPSSMEPDEANVADTSRGRLRQAPTVAGASAPAPASAPEDNAATNISPELRRRRYFRRKNVVRRGTISRSNSSGGSSTTSSEGHRQRRYVFSPVLVPDDSTPSPPPEAPLATAAAAADAATLPTPAAIATVASAQQLPAMENNTMNNDNDETRSNHSYSTSSTSTSSSIANLNEELSNANANHIPSPTPSFQEAVAELSAAPAAVPEVPPQLFRAVMVSPFLPMRVVVARAGGKAKLLSVVTKQGMSPMMRSVVYQHPRQGEHELKKEVMLASALHQDRNYASMVLHPSLANTNRGAVVLLTMMVAHIMRLYERRHGTAVHELPVQPAIMTMV